MGLHKVGQDALTEILATVVELVAAQGWEPLCMVEVVPGQQVALDYCDRCDSGMAWGRVADITAVLDEAGGGSACATAWNVSIEVGMVRGAPIMHADGEPPTPEEQAEAADRQRIETDLIFQALTCTDLTADVRVQPLIYTPIGPDGGCVGGAWVARFEVL